MEVKLEPIAAVQRVADKAAGRVVDTLVDTTQIDSALVRSRDIAARGMAERRTAALVEEQVG